MVYTALDDEYIKGTKYEKLKVITISHPKFARKVAEELNNSNEDCICYDSVILDYIDPDNLMLIDVNKAVYKFNEVYKDDLHYMFPGEVLLHEVYLYTEVE